MKLEPLMEQTELPGDIRPGGELTPEEARRILNLTLKKAGLPQKEEKRTMNRKKFGILLLAGVLCTGVVAASAAVIFHWDKRMADHLDAGEREQEMLEGAGLALGQSSEKDGWTMTVRQALGDKNQVYILLDLVAPEGTVLDGNQYYFNTYDIRLDPLGPGGYSMDLLEDDDTTDGKITFMVELEAGLGLRGSTVSMSFAELVQLRQGSQDTLAEGSWEFTFPLDYKDTGKTFRSGEKAEALGGLLEIQEVNVSPLSLSVTLKGQAVAEYDKQPPDPKTPVFDLIPIKVLDKSGNEVEGNVSGSIANDVYTFHLAFGRVLDPGDLAEVVVAGVSVPLS